MSLVDVLFEDMDADDLKDFLTEEQWEKYQTSLKTKGKVLVRGVPLLPEVSQATKQGDWSCPNMARKRYGRRNRHKSRRLRP